MPARCRVSAQGLLQYASSGEEGAVRAYEEGEGRGQSALEAQMDSARVILDEALRVGETDTHAALYAVQQSGEETTLVFMQLYGGVPVLGDSDFATFRFAEDGTLRSANHPPAALCSARNAAGPCCPRVRQRPALRRSSAA